MNPALNALVWVLAACVIGMLGYIQGRKDERLHWLEIVGNLKRRTGQQ